MKRRAFTLIELLLVIAVIGILISMLLPAVVRVREVALRARCMNNLVQLSVGLHHYEGLHQVLPPGTQQAKGPIVNEAVGYHMSWLTQILPQLDERNAFKRIDFTVGAYHPNNKTVRDLALPLLLCPLDRVSPGVKPEATSYAGCHHDVEAPIDETNAGVLFLNSRVRLEEVSDGLAYTIFLGEKIVDPGDLGWMSGTRATLRNTGSPLQTGGPSFPPTTSTTPPGDVDGAVPEPGVDALLPPGANPPAAAATSNPLFVGGFSSYHSGGVHLAMGDGSIRFFVGAGSPQIFQRLGNRKDGGLIGAEEF